MARLPDSTALGGLSSASSGRPIATPDVSGYGKGAAALAAGAKELGNDIFKVGREVGNVAIHNAK